MSYDNSERAYLEPQGILSALALPINVGGAWWGFIGFDDTKTRRIWSEEDLRLLRTSVEMIGTHLERQQDRETIKREWQQVLSIFESILKKKGGPHRWNHHNPKIGKDYFITDRLINWPDGRQVRFELAIDVSEIKQLDHLR